MSEVIFREFLGNEIASHLTELASLRIKVFREYPYRYDGNMTYETEYLEPLCKSKRSIVVMAFVGEHIVGFTSGLPLLYVHEEFQKPFITRGMDPKKVFYFEESVLLPEYRGLGVGKKFIELRAVHAEKFQEYETLAFCAVDRSHELAAIPPDYRSPGMVWHQSGFIAIANMNSIFYWKEINSSEQIAHTMRFWLRPTALGNLKILESYYQAFNEQDWEKFFSLLDDKVIHTVNQGEVRVGKTMFQEFMKKLTDSFSETLTEIILYKGHVTNYMASSYVVNGKYVADYESLPSARGQNYSLAGGAFFEINFGKITKITGYYNLTDWLHQIS